MEENTTTVTVNIEDCSPIEEAHYLKVALPDRKGLIDTLGYLRESVQYETSLSSGLLSRIKNSLILRMYKTSGTEPFVALFIKFSHDPNREVVKVMSTPKTTFTDVTGATLSYLSYSSPEYCGMGDDYLKYGYRSSSPWPDQKCFLTFEIQVYVKKLPRFEEEPQVVLKEVESLGKLEASLFDLKAFSDVVVECGSTVYPAHQAVLAANSPVFQAMLTLPTEESRKSQIIIKDVDPKVLEALLRFIYTGKVDPTILDERCDDLYRAAAKYDVKDLLLHCEAHLLKHVKPENALIMYDVAQCRPNSALAMKCREIIAKNRDNIAADVDSFKNFTIKYPEVMFEIFCKLNA